MPNARNASLILLMGVIASAIAVPGCGDDDEGMKPPDTDEVPPAVVTNLAAVYSTVSSIDLTWTAPGDDGMSGRATRYDIRYSDLPLTAESWSDATAVGNPPQPKLPGLEETFTVVSLQPNTEYYFGIKTGDDVPNWSVISNVVSKTTRDGRPPANVSDLTVSSTTETSVMLAWSAPGDNDNEGSASSYDVRYSTSEIIEQNWDSATQVDDEPVPSTAGTIENLLVDELQSNTTYYFALKTVDDVSNWSGLSNVANTTTAIGWSPLGSGMNGWILTLTVYGGDLIAGGRFVSAGGTEVNHIAAWDGTSWNSLDSGMNYDVVAMAVHKGELIAGGGFTTAGDRPIDRIARWDGSSWNWLGGGMLAPVYSLVSYNEDLIAGGAFRSAGGVPANHIARWDGDVWHPLGSGRDERVKVLTVFDGYLIAAEPYPGGVSRWDGSSWSPLGSISSVYSLTVHNGELIAGGGFVMAGDVTVNHVARWDGSSWNPLGSGMDEPVYALVSYNGDLIAGGDFRMAGNTATNHVARWDGSSWSQLGEGMHYEVFDLTVYNGDLIAGGVVRLMGGIARWSE